MLTYLARKLVGGALTLFLLVAMTFFLLRLAPGGPFDTDRAWPPEVQANIERAYGLDQPLTAQFGRWLADLAHGDLRESFQYLGTPVADIISQSLPPSLLLGGVALLISILIGVPLGCLSAWKPGSWLDGASMFLAIAGVSVPSYLVASLLVLVFSLWLGWLPPALWESQASLVLPVLTLATRPMAVVARLTRAAMLEALTADYIRTAYGKGLADSSVIFKHALKNSLIPVITVLGPLAASLVTGSFLVETVFQIPGLGKHFVQAVINRDYPLVMGVTLVYGVILIVSNLAVDVVYGWADPRIRVDEGAS